MADRGRPTRGVEISNVLLRIPATLLEQVDTFKDTLESERGGFRTNRTDVLTRLIEVGLQTLTQARQPVAQPASPVDGYGAPQPTAQPAIPLALEPAPTTAHQVPVSQATETPAPRAKRPASHALPRETLQAIADERTLCEGLSLREFAQRLHVKGIYSATAKDGSHVPANPGNVKKWLEQAQEAGLL